MRGNPRLVIALVIVGIGLLSYYGSKQINPITGEEQAIALTPEQEIALGLQSAPRMAAQFGGLDPDERAQELVQAIGARLVQSTVASQTPYEFQFYALADEQIVNAFALPGGPVFITRALLARLEDEAQLAGVLGHEIGHVLGRHSAERIAKQQLAQSIVSAVGMASDDPYSAQQIAGVVANMVQMKYGREDELQSDSLGVELMADAGYDPSALIDVMRILEEASGGQTPPEYMSSHPNPGNRAERIKGHIERRLARDVGE
jgi:predicted Zn-dependent protease